MNADKAEQRSEPQPPLSDSPWFWVRLFSLMALAALVAIGPKYAQRQADIERQFEGRTRAAYRDPAVPPPPDAAPEPRGNLIPLAPLIVLVAAIAIVSHVALLRSRLPRKPKPSGDSGEKSDELAV